MGHLIEPTPATYIRITPEPAAGQVLDEAAAVPRSLGLRTTGVTFGSGLACGFANEPITPDPFGRPLPPELAPEMDRPEAYKPTPPVLRRATLAGYLRPRIEAPPRRC